MEEYNKQIEINSQAYNNNTHWRKMKGKALFCVYGCRHFKANAFLLEFSELIVPMDLWPRFKCVILKRNFGIDILSTQVNMTLGQMPKNDSNDKSNSVRVITRYREATSHCMRQFGSSSLTPYGVTRP